jgi:LysM repeat protein
MGDFYHEFQNSQHPFAQHVVGSPVVDDKKAIELATASKGVPLTDIERDVVKAEGFGPDWYLDTSGIPTIGIGQTGQWAFRPFSEAVDSKIKMAKGVFPDYDKYDHSTKSMMVDAAYRGDLRYGPESTKKGQPQKWTKLFNEGKYDQAAKEHVDHPNYIDDKIGGGIRNRFDNRVSEMMRLHKANLPTTYTVKSGDNLTRIAAANGMTVDQLAGMNSIQDPNSIQVGQQLQLQTQGIPQATQEAPPKEDAGFLSPVDDFINSLFGGDKSGKPKKEITDMIPPKHKETFKSFWD